jgi:hypothetical protein
MCTLHSVCMQEWRMKGHVNVSIELKNIFKRKKESLPLKFLNASDLLFVDLSLILYDYGVFYGFVCRKVSFCTPESGSGG